MYECVCMYVYKCIENNLCMCMKILFKGFTRVFKASKGTEKEKSGRARHVQRL